MTRAKDRRVHAAEASTTKEGFGRSIIDALPAHIAVLDDRGIIIAVNRHWVRFAAENGLPDPTPVCEGADYLAVCRKAADLNDPLAHEAMEAIEAVIGGQLPSFSLDYPCHSPAEQRWFTIDVRRCQDIAATVVAHLNITQRKRAEDTLRDAHERLANIVEFLPDATFVVDKDKRVVAWNRACEIMTGVKKEAVLGQGDYAYAKQFFGERSPVLIDLLDMPISEIEAKYTYVQRTGNTVQAGAFVPGVQDGKGPHLWGTAAPLFDQQGRRCGAVEVIRDVTGNKRVEQALRASEQKLRAIFEQAPLGIAIIDSVTGGFLKVNQQYCKITGYSQSEMLDRSFQEITHADDVQQDLANMQRLRDGEVHMFQMDKRYIRKDGSLVWVRLTCVPLWEESRTQMSHIAMVEDITARKEAEARLAESERKYRELVECANSIILRWTREGRITFLNEFGQRFFGYSAQEIVGRHVMGTIVPSSGDDGRDLRQLMDQICADPVAFEQNVNQNMRRSGERVWIAWTNKVVKDEQGQVVEILSVGTDITQLKRAEEAIRELNTSLERRVAQRTAELAVAKDRAEEAARLKSVFLASMSHELRTPLNSIIGFTGILLQGLPGPLNPEQIKQLEMVRTSSRHLLSLINDVLDLSKVEAGQMTVARGTFSMPQSIETALKALEPLAHEKGLSFEVRVDPAVGKIVADRRKTEQILMNLGSNAIKFTGKGAVRIDCRIEGTDLVTSVTDGGIGIKAEDMGKLFEMFQQIPAGQPRSGGGTGLGLAICKKLVEIQGGKIWATSEFGVGSTFSFTLPLDAGEQ